MATAQQPVNQQAIGGEKWFAPVDGGEYPAQRVAESWRAGKGEAMARRRFQRGQLVRRVVRNSMGQIDRDRSVWLGRWREDEIRQGKPARVRRSLVLGTLRDLETEKQAARVLAECIRKAGVNDLTYRPRPRVTFADFSTEWQKQMRGQFKASTWLNFTSHLRKHLEPYFGAMPLREIRSEILQRFVSSLAEVSPKTARNLMATLRVVWNSAREWEYIEHDPFPGVRLPRGRQRQQPGYTLEEIQKIIGAAPEPQRTFYWLAAETGMRAGELCGLRVEDLDLNGCAVSVSQSVWRGKVQDPKTLAALRSFRLSPQLARHLGEYLRIWRPNPRRLLFVTRNGTPWDANLLVKRKLHPLLRSLGIQGGGLHAFRHGNATLLDRLQVPLKVRQQRLGHTDARLTLGIYTHVASADDELAAAKLGRILDSDVDLTEKTGASLAANPGVVN